MKPLLIAATMVLASGATFAQTATTPANPKPNMPAVTTPSTPTPMAPAAGANSFTMQQAKSRIEGAGFSAVTGLAKDKDGVWRATATKDGASHNVSLDYQGNVIAG